jgi:hypothetical protein
MDGQSEIGGWDLYVHGEGGSKRNVAKGLLV